MGNLQDKLPNLPARNRPRVKLPAGLTVSRTAPAATPTTRASLPYREADAPRRSPDGEQELTITRSWWSGTSALLWVLAISVDLVVSVFFLTEECRPPSGICGENPAVTSLLTVAMWCAAAVATYLAITWTLNETTIRVTRDELSLRHHPLPWPGGGAIRVRELAQLHCEEKRMPLAKAPEEGELTPQNMIYAVMATLRSGKKRKLVSGLANPEQALYIEQLIEETLGIRDRPMEGEFRG